MSLIFPAPCIEVLILPEAAVQIEEIAERYEQTTEYRAARPEAIRRLREAVANAEGALLAGRRVRRRFPSIYRSMAHGDEEWLHMHRYWFGYIRVGESAVIFAVLDEQAKMGRRAR